MDDGYVFGAWHGGVAALAVAAAAPGARKETVTRWAEEVDPALASRERRSVSGCE